MTAGLAEVATDRHKNLVKLGADTLATALLDLATYNNNADAVVERLLASPKESAKSFAKRLSSVKRRQRFISWGESAAYARELAELLNALEASEPEPKAGVLSVAAFYEADAEIFEQCDDSNGSVGDVFQTGAADLFVLFASQCEDKEWLLELVLTLNTKNDYGIRDVLFTRMSEFLPETVLRRAVDRLWELAKAETRKYSTQGWLIAINHLSWQLKDVRLLEQVKRAMSDSDELPVAYVIDIAKLNYQCGDLQTALTWIERVPLKATYMARERDELLTAIYQCLKKPKKLIETASRVFRQHRDINSLDQLVKAVGEDKRAGIIEEQAKAILKANKFEPGDAGFLVETGRIDDAEKYIIANANLVDGGYYSSLLDLAKAMLRYDRLVAACVIYRALLDSILARAKSKTYHHGVSYLKKLDYLAKKVDDWKGLDSHSTYLDNLRAQHRLKSSFWSQYD